jgi:hypothetical protein
MAKVKASPTDMKLMAIGEVGALLLSIAAAVWVVLVLDDVAMFIRAVGALAAMYVVARMALGFVHLGYVPDKDGSKG